MRQTQYTEERLASYVGVKHALLTSMGRTALVIALKTLGIGPGDHVIVPSFTCDTVPKSVEFCGATPVFADVDPFTFNVDPSKIEKKITRNVKAVVVIHCYGQPADLKEILEITQKNNIFLIEDVAHSLGAEYYGKKAGNFGHLSVFSFSKNMGCSSGGAVATNADQLISRVNETLEDFSTQEGVMGHFKDSTKWRLLTYGRTKKSFLSSVRLLGTVNKILHLTTDTSEIPKVFSADDKVKADVLKGLETINHKNEERRRKAKTLTELIKNLNIDYVEPPIERRNLTHVYYQYGLKVYERKNVLKKMRSVGKHVRWSLPWQCLYGENARKLSEQLVLFSLDAAFKGKDLQLVASTLSKRSGD